MNQIRPISGKYYVICNGEGGIIEEEMDSAGVISSFIP